MELPPTLYTRKYLHQPHAYGNILKFIHSDLGALTTLHILIVGPNQIDELPESSAKYTELEPLHVNENCISSLTPSFINLQKLKPLHVNSNDSLSVKPREVRCTDVTAMATSYARGATIKGTQIIYFQQRNNVALF